MKGVLPALFDNLHIQPDYCIIPFPETHPDGKKASLSYQVFRIAPRYRNPILKTFPADIRNSMKSMILSGRKQSYGAGTG
jgi:hypothetical protein